MPEIRLGPCIGMNTSLAPTQLGPDQARLLQNMYLMPGSLGVTRRGMTRTTNVTGATSTMYQVIVEPSFSTAGIKLVFWGTNSIGYAANPASGMGVVNTLSTSSTFASWADNRPYAVVFNNKLFIAANSNLNRLHLWDGNQVSATLRVVGIEASAAATVANTGAGAYAATLRYYKIQFKLISGSTTVATSELSPAVSFTPSGAGTAARVTKPTTPDAATHWVVFGSADGVNYYNLSGNILVATTTYDDSAAPSGYSANAIAPSAGLYVPPPSCKFLLATDNRLFMAGAWETTATSTQTVPYTSRVWFTDPLGALDNTGEDESVANVTNGRKNWVDCGEKDGDEIVGLGGPLDGVIYVFKARSIWRLVPTGLDEDPYRPEVVTRALGATWHDGIILAETDTGQPCLYFIGSAGLCELTSAGSIVELSRDLASNLSYPAFGGPGRCVLAWNRAARMLWCVNALGSDTFAWAYQPDFVSVRPQYGRTGGWTKHVFELGQTVWGSARIAGGLLNVYGGDGSGNEIVGSEDGNADNMTDGSTPFVCTYRSGTLQPQGPLQLLHVRAPIVERLNTGSGSAAHALTLANAVYGGPTQAGSVTASFTSPSYSGIAADAMIQERYEGLQLSDVVGLQVTLTPGDQGVHFVGITIPYEVQPR